MNYSKVILHESQHACAGAATALLRSVKHGLAVKPTYQNITLYFAKGDHTDDVLAECAFSVSHKGLSKDITAGAALAPAICSDEAATTNAIKAGDPTMLFGEHLSDTDIKAFEKYGSLLLPDDVLLAGLASDEFHKRLGPNLAAFLEKLEEASRRHDSLLPLHRIYPLDIVRGCLDSIKPGFQHTCKRLRFPDEYEDDRLRRQWEAKQKINAAAEAADRLIKRKKELLNVVR